ncbi:MAG: 5-carboxymethyl-2-hydroxymuconate isomerase [Allorhizobium sp.]
MPHFIIEQGNALLTSQDRRDAMEIAGEVGTGCGFITAADIKLRICDYADFLHLDGCRSFIHLTVHLLAGRTGVQKEALTISLRTALSSRFPDVDSISIVCCDMDPISYKKFLRPRLADRPGGHAA